MTNLFISNPLIHSNIHIPQLEEKQVSNHKLDFQFLNHVQIAKPHYKIARLKSFHIIIINILTKQDQARCCIEQAHQV